MSNTKCPRCGLVGWSSASNSSTSNGPEIAMRFMTSPAVGSCHFNSPPQVITKAGFFIDVYNAITQPVYFLDAF